MTTNREFLRPYQGELSEKQASDSGMGIVASSAFQAQFLIARKSGFWPRADVLRGQGYVGS